MPKITSTTVNKVKSHVKLYSFSSSMVMSAQTEAEVALSILP